MGSILLVESDPDGRERLEAVVREAGHEPVVVLSLADAFSPISDGGIDVVVIDSHDPRVGVLELVRSIQALPDAPPIILISSSPHAPEISARIGAAAFLAKPFELGELITLLGGLLGKLRPVRIVNDEPSGPVRQFGQSTR